MRYLYSALTKTSAIIEIIPVTEEEIALVRMLDIQNPDHEMTIHFHFQKGLELNNASAVLLGIDRFIKVPSKAVVSFEVAIGFGGD